MQVPASRRQTEPAFAPQNSGRDPHALRDSSTGGSLFSQPFRPTFAIVLDTLSRMVFQPMRDTPSRTVSPWAMTAVGVFVLGRA